MIVVKRLKTYRNSLCSARAAYYSSQTEKNRHSQRYLFISVARLKESHSPVEPCAPLTLNSNDYLSSFYDKITIIKNKIYYLMLSTGANLSSDVETLESSLKTYIYIINFSPSDLYQLT